MIGKIISGEIDSLELKPWSDAIRWKLLQEFDNHVIGQSSAKAAIVDSILSNINSIIPKKWPLAVLFFYWPTGTGKTECTHALATMTLGNPDRLTKIKCEHLQTAHSVTNLTGAPKSYVWYSDPPLLSPKIYEHAQVANNAKEASNIVRRFPNFNIIVFDEIEKAHPTVHQALLGIMDDWKITLSNGDELDFRESIIIMTSNIWAREKREIKSKRSIWFSEQNSESDAKIAEKEAFKLFSPEFMWRIDARIEFSDLSKADCKRIIDIYVKKINDVLEIYHGTWDATLVELHLSDWVYDKIIEEGYDNEKGARSLVRAFNNRINTVLWDIMNNAEDLFLHPEYKAKIRATIDKWEIRFKVKKEDIKKLPKNYPLLIW